MEHLRVKLPWGLRHQTIISDCTVQSVCLQKPSSNPTDVWPPWVPQSFLINPFPVYWAGAQLGVTLPGCEDEPCPGPVFTPSWGAAPWPQTVTLKQHP